MSSFKLISIILIALIFFSSIKCQLPESQLYNKINTDVEWDVVKPGWPVEDPSDIRIDKRSHFFYIKDITGNNFNQLWLINQTYVSNLKSISNTYKMSFKFWIHTTNRETYKPSVQYKYLYSHDINAEYTDGNYAGQWMAQEFAVSYDNMLHFEMTTNPTDISNVIGLKDYTLEYETVDTIRSNFTPVLPETFTHGLQPKEWSKYIKPSDIPVGMNSDGEYLYFSNECPATGCVLYSSNFNAHNEPSATLTFMYWIRGTASGLTKIEVNLGTFTQPIQADGAWHTAEVKNIANPRGIEIRIITAVTTLDTDYSFVAIKDLEVLVNYKESGADRQHKYVCTQTDCLWNLSGFSYLFWSKHMPLPLDKTYFYPRNENNSLEYYFDSANSGFSTNVVDMNDVDLCFLLEYYTASEKHVTINIGYNIRGDTYRDTIVSIRPKVGQTDTAFMCVRDMIALNSKDFVISFAVQQYDYRYGFALRVTADTKTNFHRPTGGAVWDFEGELLSFLTKWDALYFSAPFNWPQDWESFDEDFNKHFKPVNDNALRFTATATSKTPTSVHLISKWIKYDPKLHDIDGQFTIQTQTTAMFHAFTVKPRVCDWLMHCVDAVVDDRNALTSTLRTYTFKFASMAHSKYIKLLFYVEYFEPASYLIETPFNIEFDLRLEHFGDPCYHYADKCRAYDTTIPCYSNKRNLMSVPNVPECECDSKHIEGVDCSAQNYCTATVPGLSVTMGEHCGAKGLVCENRDGYANKAKCVCNKAPNIVWSEAAQDCVSPTIFSINQKNWEALSGSHDHYYPTKVDNELTINFPKFDHHKHDACLLIEYASTRVVSLRAEYVHQSTPRQVLFNVSLHEQPSGGSFKLCMRDFVYTIHEDFAVAFIVGHPRDYEWTDAIFSLHYTPQIGVLSKSINYLRNWKHAVNQTHDTYTKWIDWVSFIPDNSFDRSGISNDAYQVNFNAPINGQIPSQAMMISEWIVFNNLLTPQKNMLSFKYPPHTKSYLSMRIKIMNQNGIIVRTSEAVFEDSETPTDDGKILATKTAFPITNLNNGDPFKMIIEITYAEPVIPPANTLTSLEIDFVDISVGDPCYDLNTHQIMCKNNAICRGYGPNKFSCYCTDDEFGGRYCDQTNECRGVNQAKCDAYPSVPRDTRIHDTAHTTCLTNYTVNPAKYQCVCAGDYIWKSTSDRCIRKSYHKTTVHCEGPLTDTMTSCPFMSHTRPTFGWSNSNIPPIYDVKDARLPFYYPTKVNSELKIAVRNLNVSTDACFKFHYYLTDGSQLKIKFNDHEIIGLTPTRVYAPNVNKEITSWRPEIGEESEQICLRKYFFANNFTEYYNITFVANITDLSNNMIALKFIGDQSVTEETKSYVSFSARTFEHMDVLPYLIHWSRYYGLDHDKYDNDSKVDNKNFDFDNQWPLRFPSKRWTPDLNADTVSFKGSLTSVRNVAYLMSNWLQKEVEGYKLRFKISSISQYLRFAIETRVYDNTMKVVQTFEDKRIGDSSILERATVANSLAQVYHINKVNTTFRVGFTVYYQLRQNEKHLPDIEFKLELIDVGDPCVNDSTTFNGCSDHGYCTRLGPVDKHDCNCASGFELNKDNCNMTDWCKYRDTIGSEYTTGAEFCSTRNAGVCWNLQHPKGGLSFQCNCTANKTEWDAENKVCEKIKQCLLSNKCDSRSEICIESATDDTTEPSCVCNEAAGYRNITGSNRCEFYDPCNTDHNPEPCGASKAHCFRTGLATATDGGYVCVCPRGYETHSDKQSTECRSVMCDFHGLNNCQQRCFSNNTANTGFTCGCFDDWYTVSTANSSECTARPDKPCNCRSTGFCYNNNADLCTCHTGYVYVNDTCQPITTNPINPAICPDGKVKEVNGVLVCDCNEALYDVVDRHCELKPICGAGSPGRANCEAKNAKCVNNRTEIGNYECQCPTGKVFENGHSTADKNDANNYTCIDYCALSKREEICELINARCDASKVFDHKTGNIYEFHDFEFCECKPGYVRVNTTSGGFECSLAQSTYELNLLIKDTFAQYNNVSITYERLVHISRETLRRKKRQTATTYESLNAANKLGYYSDVNSSYHLNNQLDSQSRANINKAEFAIFLSTRLTNILNETPLGNTLQSVTVESCRLNAEQYYDCVFSVTLDSALEHKDEIANHLLGACHKQTDPTDCYIRNGAEANTLVFKSASFVVENYDPCDTKRSAVNCPEYTACKHVNFPNSSYYACVCDTDFDVKSNRTILNEHRTLATYIDSCKPKDLCAVHCRAVTADGGRCEQEQPRYNISHNKWMIPTPRCYCATNKVLDLTTNTCYDPCPSTLCHNHGNCRVLSASPWYVCACTDGWSGEHCDHDSSSKSRTGWIVSVVILAVLLLVAVGLALGFAYKFKQSSMRTKQNSGFMNKRISLEDLQSSQTGGQQHQSTMYSQQQSYH